MWSFNWQQLIWIIVEIKNENLLKCCKIYGWFRMTNLIYKFKLSNLNLFGCKYFGLYLKKCVHIRQWGWLQSLLLFWIYGYTGIFNKIFIISKKCLITYIKDTIWSAVTMKDEQTSLSPGVKNAIEIQKHLQARCPTQRRVAPGTGGSTHACGTFLYIHSYICFIEVCAFTKVVAPAMRAGNGKDIAWNESDSMHTQFDCLQPCTYKHLSM